jgi:hypothetical protein
MHSIAEKQKARAASIDALSKKMNSPGPSEVHKDSDPFYQLPIDKATNQGGATIRFLPESVGDDAPYVAVCNHAFPENGIWFIEGCPTTIDLDCPVCENNKILYSSGDPADKIIAANRKRKMSFVSNILVISDQQNPANQGKVFLFKYGTRIFEKLRELVAPSSDLAGVEPIDPFDVEHGPNFMLRVIKGDRYSDYQKSAFDQELTSIGDEDKIAAVLSQRKSLAALIDPSQFKPYFELKEKFEKMTGLRTPELDEKDFSPNVATSGPLA